MRRFALVLLTATFAFSGLVSASDDEISARELLARSGEGLVVLDVRTPAEYQAGHVPGAINIPHDELASRIAELDRHRGDEIVLYCQRGGRAGKARDVLADAGFSELLHLQGNMSGWRAAGHAIHMPETSSDE